MNTVPLIKLMGQLIVKENTGALYNPSRCFIWRKGKANKKKPIHAYSYQQLRQKAWNKDHNTHNI